MKVSRNLNSSIVPPGLYLVKLHFAKGLVLMSLKVVSWNIHRCFGSDRKYRPDRIAQVLADIDADVVALQEVDSSLRVNDEIDQLTYLANGLGLQAIMGPTLNRDYGVYGNAILTRAAPQSARKHDLSFRKFEPRGALIVELATGTIPVRIVNVHLGLKYWERAFQIERLLKELIWKDIDPDLEETTSTILLGDFNEWFPYTFNGVRLRKAFPFASPRFRTFPAAWPRFALDRIFASGRINEFHCEVSDTAGSRIASDHLPVIASLRFA